MVSVNEAPVVVEPAVLPANISEHNLETTTNTYLAEVVGVGNGSVTSEGHQRVGGSKATR